MSLHDHLRMYWFNYSMIAFAIGFSYFAGRREDSRSNCIPKAEHVEQGYVVPSKLEIKVTDTNLNGKGEVLMVYDNTRYLLTVDENGKPQVEDYLENLDKRLEIE